MNSEIKNRGLQPLPVDKRDFSHSQVLGAAKLADLPDEFTVCRPLEIKNQDINYLSDYCTEYGASSVAEDEDKVPFVPEWSFAQVKRSLAKKNGPSVYNEFGLNLRDVCQGAVDFGFLPRSSDPYQCDTDKRPPRDFILTPSNWPSSLFSFAAPFKKASFFAIDGPYDVFDNIRSALWLNRDADRTALTGCIWRESWNTTPYSVIPDQYESIGGGHAFKIYGWKIIEGETYLMAHMSDGPKFGDNGTMYFPREVANKELGAYGAFMFNDLPVNVVKLYQQCDIKINDSLLLKVLKLVSSLIQKICPQH